MTTVEMGAEQAARRHMAPDAFDLPAALAARERAAPARRSERVTTEPDAAAARATDLPPVFVPSAAR